MSLLRPAFQSVVELADPGEHRLAYFEVLMRVNNDASGRLHGSLIAAGEQMGFIGALDVEMLKMVLDVLDSGTAEKLAMNVSVDTFEYFHAELLTKLRNAQRICRGRLMIEVTETHPPEDYGRISIVADSIRDLGVDLALDDFGDGFADSLMVDALRPRIIKISGNAIHNQSILDTAARLRDQFDADLVAECIQSEADAQRLRRLGMRYGQGFHFARPQFELRHPKGQFGLQVDIRAIGGASHEEV